MCAQCASEKRFATELRLSLPYNCADKRKKIRIAIGLGWHKKKSIAALANHMDVPAPALADAIAEAASYEVSGNALLLLEHNLYNLMLSVLRHHLKLF